MSWDDDELKKVWAGKLVYDQKSIYFKIEFKSVVWAL